jgi:homocysteine S-methyltransferase
MNSLAKRILERAPLILDGALATELERRGHDLNHALWSAKLLLEDPGALREVHLAYLRAGADCIATAGYQASIPGLRACGLGDGKARELYLDSIRIAVQARDAFAIETGSDDSDAPPALVAASIGPYGAYLADGSEYRGNYVVSTDKLDHFHRERIELVQEAVSEGSAPDLIAFETIPSLDEAMILVRILESTRTLPAWISFSCRDDALTCEGQPIEECGAALDDRDAVVAIGINCTSPHHIPALIEKLAGATSKPILAYPNSGETYDAKRHCWQGVSVFGKPEEAAARWVAAGASGVGGCCRTTPEDIARLVRWRDGSARS